MVGVWVAVSDKLGCFGEQDRGLGFAAVHVVVVVRFAAGGGPAVLPVLEVWEQDHAGAVDVDFLAGDDLPITDRQLAANRYLLYFAGLDTQRLTFGNMIVALYRNREALAYLARTRDHAHRVARTTILSGDSVLVSVTAPWAVRRVVIGH
jgi:cytochrome P450